MMVVSFAAQCPIGTTMSFEKIASVTVRGAPLVPLYNGQPEIPVTAECNNRCRAGPKCRAFLLSYDKHQCFGLDYESLGRGISIVNTAEKTSYFEKICLSTAPCEKAWTFERVMGRELKGFDNRILSGVASRLRCQELCLKERSFVCRSGKLSENIVEQNTDFSVCRRIRLRPTTMSTLIGRSPFAADRLPSGTHCQH